MTKVIPGRQIADVSAALGDDADSFVVFIIGFRINKPWLLHKWVPPFMAMPPMLRELASHPELGLLGSRMTLGSTVSIIQYWRSFDDLERFAKGEHHLPAWRKFNARFSASGAAGLYHETYQVNVADYEAIYHNMPTYGLAAATAAVPMSAKTESARSRLASASPNSDQVTDVTNSAVEASGRADIGGSS